MGLSQLNNTVNYFLSKLSELHTLQHTLGGKNDPTGDFDQEELQTGTHGVNNLHIPTLVYKINHQP